MWGKPKKFLFDNSGVAATEFALIAPTLLLIMLGILDFGEYINTQMNLENTARAAAEFVVDGGDPDDIEEQILLNSGLGLTEDTLDTVDVDADYECACHDGTSTACVGGTCEGDDDYVHRYFYVTLTMNNYQPLISFPGLPDNMTLTGHVVLRVN